MMKRKRARRELRENGALVSAKFCDESSKSLT
jgi:hypothetical protein